MVENWPDIFGDKDEGFGKAQFLSEAEWRTYLKRAPVRYPRRNRVPDPICEVCGKPASDSNPLTLAHRIPFVNGVRYFALTPDFLDEEHNTAWAHKSGCNKTLKMGFEKSLQRLRQLSIKTLPAFLPRTVLDAWR